MNDPHDSEFARRSVRLLDASVRSLDAATLSRLNRARQAALSSSSRRRRWAWAGGVALASACSLALVLVSGVQRQAAPTRAPTDTVSTVGEDALFGADELALYEDLEFYAWLGSKSAIDASAADAAPGEPL
ncbi:MAG: DUF3619 family protein [Dokdonella sp.]